ncbi:MAG: hypothetical protein OK457_08010 [Thaumarchaeota archaeon]|nr:hypothetical protein [Nitrososphaerota archaeon]
MVTKSIMLNTIMQEKIEPRTKKYWEKLPKMLGDESDLGTLLFKLNGANSETKVFTP